MKSDRHLRQFAVLFALIMLSGCQTLFGSDEADSAESASSGTRVAVLNRVKTLEVDEGAKDITIDVPLPTVNDDWAQVGGNTQHAVGNLALTPQPAVIWRASIGDGSSKYFRLFAQPVINGGKVFTIDAQGEVAAFRADNGDRLWRFDTTPENSSGEAMGAGVAASGDKVYVTTGFGEVIAIKAADGAPLWRKMIGKPLRSAPTVAKDLVFVVTIDNEMHALAAETGAALWHHNGIAESATLMGASSPAADGDSVVVAYSSGEIFNLRAQNGRVAWTDVLAVPEKLGALPAIADIRGLPVIDRGLVFAMSHSDRMAAIDQRTGDRAWDADFGGVNTPFVAGNAVYAVNNNNELVALLRENGRVLWIKQLQKLEDPADKDSKAVFWWGPVLAGGRLWLTNSLGHLMAFGPESGVELVDNDIGDAFYMPPVVANGVMYLLDDSGRLTALR